MTFQHEIILLVLLKNCFTYYESNLRSLVQIANYLKQLSWVQGENPTITKCKMQRIRSPFFSPTCSESGLLCLTFNICCLFQCGSEVKGSVKKLIS